MASLFSTPTFVAARSRSGLLIAGEGLAASRECCCLPPCSCENVNIIGMIVQFEGQEFVVGSGGIIGQGGSSVVISDGEARWVMNYEQLGQTRYSLTLAFQDFFCPRLQDGSPNTAGDRVIEKTVSLTCDLMRPPFEEITGWIWTRSSICFVPGPDGICDPETQSRAVLDIGNVLCEEGELPEGDIEDKRRYPLVQRLLDSNPDLCEPSMPSFTIEAPDDDPP